MKYQVAQHTILFLLTFLAPHYRLPFYVIIFQIPCFLLPNKFLRGFSIDLDLQSRLFLNMVLLGLFGRFQFFQ